MLEGKVCKCNTQFAPRFVGNNEPNGARRRGCALSYRPTSGNRGGAQNAENADALTCARNGSEFAEFLEHYKKGRDNTGRAACYIIFVTPRK